MRTLRQLINRRSIVAGSVVIGSLILLPAVAPAATIAGVTADTLGGAIPAARVTLLNIATSAELVAETDKEGRFRFDGLPVGAYRVAVLREGFSEDARTVSIADPGETIDLSFVLRLGGLTFDVTVTAARGQRDERLVPLRLDAIPRDELVAKNPTSTGDGLIGEPGITPVGSGPFQVRPRLRGLDSTRVLVLVDGERLNNARTATDRAGVEVGLADLGSVQAMEVVSGSGSVLYGTDALSGTINILTGLPQFAGGLRLDYGFDGFYSTNERGRRGTATFGVSHRRVAVQVIGTRESFDSYEAGRSAAREETGLFFDQGILSQADTIDDAFGFSFGRFPDPFNAPYARSNTVVPRSGAEGSNLNASGLVRLSDRQTVRVKYLRRRMENVGFPDFEPPFFFSRISLPYSNLDRVSARYEAQSITPWFTNLKVSAYHQDQRRLLRNEFPVQFPVPSPRFFPVSVFRLDILSDTEQHVRTPGVDVQGTFVAGVSHVITAGATVYRDGSEDARTTVTTTTQIGSVSLGPRGPEAVVFPSPVVLGPPATTHPVRVPDSSFRAVGLYAQDEWQATDRLRVVAGLRVDRYRVTTRATVGYDVASIVAGAQPAIDPGSLPRVDGDEISRTALTGDLGALFRVNDVATIVGHYGRSYRHPNLEELLFSGPATVGAIAPNLGVEPEKGHNVDLGVRLRTDRYAASVSYFNNTYDGFISTEIVASTPRGPISRAVNFADVRIQGVEGGGEVPVAIRPGVLSFSGNVAWTRGTVLEGANPLTGTSLDGTPQDNITPLKVVAAVRFTDTRDRFWIEYGGRAQARVKRVATTLLESPFLIAQDLLSLEDFAVQRLAWGVNFRRTEGRLGLVFAVENLTDAYYREQFQFAPARGRTFTIGVSMHGR
jgi:hemoglobin/transferrin/lactoferrin receptor protein